jgi:hypothetical protein
MFIIPALSEENDAPDGEEDGGEDEGVEGVFRLPQRHEAAHECACKSARMCV